MSFTNFLEAELLDHVFGNASYSAPATLYVGLCTYVAEDGTITGEPSGSSYARVAVTNNATNFPAASGGSKANGATITFPEATGSWGTLYTFFISDAATAGNILGYGDLTTPRTIDSGTIVRFDIGALTITLD